VAGGTDGADDFGTAGGGAVRGKVLLRSLLTTFQMIPSKKQSW
jgi:hypothetical protein